MSKLTYSDKKKFDNLMQDMFPGVNMTDIKYKEVEEAIL